jgi:hypothetical protein
VTPALGRVFSELERVRVNVVVFTAYGSDASGGATSRPTHHADGAAYTVVGVTPPGSVPEQLETGRTAAQPSG